MATKILRERDRMPTPPPTKGPHGANVPGPRRPSPKAPRRDPWIRLVWLIGAVTPFILAIINSSNSTPERPGRPPQGTNSPPPVFVPTNPPGPGTGRLEGRLTDRWGRPISSLLVGVRSGPETFTDARGVFVLPGVRAGDQLLVVRSPSERGREWTQHLLVASNGNTQVNIAYDPASSRLGLLTLTAPVDGAILEVKHIGQQYLAEAYGRCDGLNEIFESKFDVWVLIRSQLDQRLWVQHPSALVDLTSGTWKANIQMGSAETPPQNGERWDIIAVAAPADSQIKRILNAPSLSDLPEHIRANFITVETKLR